ncbi:MAG: hypothetical protein H6707_19875 [Deltaproteobacteria bacterium]|nr:hypothetical protein [Deltaproteobacteria bacterium]
MNTCKSLMSSLVLGAVVCAWGGCGNAPELELGKATKSAEAPDPGILGYAIGRNPLALYRLHFDNTTDVEWSAEYVDDLPESATSENIGIGGLAAHPTNPKVLYLSFDRGTSNGAEMWKYTLTLGVWTKITDYNPAGTNRYWGLGSLCSGDLTSVSRPYSTSSFVNGTLVSFDPSTPQTTTTLFTANAFAIADNDSNYGDGVTNVFGLDGSNNKYVTDDGSNYYTYGSISENWLVGAMSNPVLWDFDPHCTFQYIVAAANSSSQSTATPLYVVRHNTSSGNSQAMGYYNAYSQSQPALVDLSNIPGYCRGPWLCINQ